MIGGAILFKKMRAGHFFSRQKNKKKEIVDWSVKNDARFFLLATLDAQKKVKSQFKKTPKVSGVDSSV